MSVREMMQRPAKTAAHTRAKFVGAYYLITLLACAFVFSFHGRLALAADFIAVIFYLAITALFYGWSKSGREEAENAATARAIDRARRS